ncbi:uncharacterized protein LOC114361131, partial [Ostrinia furnacalis]|uniref:uncharacterized protein LOC114361131 n=1 Tax=Ostrinia furnacalis TaxID=93504 RepID=UPI00103DB327
GSRATERRETLIAPNLPGATGLHNLGNTCFMNAALQSVWNTGPLTQYFNSGMHMYELNTANPLGTKGALALRFGELCKEVWSCSARSVAPLRVRWVVSRHARALAGGGQHDAQELLAWLLDALHEDLNRAAPPPAAPAPADSDGRPDQVSDVTRGLLAWLLDALHEDLNRAAPPPAAPAPADSDGRPDQVSDVTRGLLAWLLDALHEDLNRAAPPPAAPAPADSDGRPDQVSDVTRGLLAWLLDALHEDLNRAAPPPAAPAPADSDGRPDQVSDVTRGLLAWLLDALHEDLNRAAPPPAAPAPADSDGRPDQVSDVTRGLLAWLLDALHEDLNRAAPPPAAPAPADSDGRPDQVSDVTRGLLAWLLDALHEDLNRAAPPPAAPAPADSDGRPDQVSDVTRGLLAWLLDALHEDLNRAAPPPAAPAPADSDGRPDQVVAAESWAAYTARNQSILTELFCGQLKSRVRCVTCSRDSVRFDSFNMLSLPLPMESIVRAEVRVILLDGSVPVKYGVRVHSEGTYLDLKQKLAKLCGLEPDSMLLVELSGATIGRVLEDGHKVCPARAMQLYAYELPPAPPAPHHAPCVPGWSGAEAAWAEVSAPRGPASSLCMPALFCFKVSTRTDTHTHTHIQCT